MYRVTTIAVAAVAALAIQGCSTMDRINAQDWTPYSGTKMASHAGNQNAADAVSSAVADTVLLPFTATSYALGYRYDPNTHSMRQTANNWGWSSYPPNTAAGSPTYGSGATSGTTSSTHAGDTATGSTGSTTASGTGGGTPSLGTSMSSTLSPEPGARPATPYSSATSPGATLGGGAGSSSGATSGAGGTSSQ